MGYLDDLELFPRLRDASSKSWSSYVEHAFVAQLANGTLPEASFRHYLGQDYLFLIHFARAYALAAYKADNLAEIRDAAAGMSAIVDTEMALHVDYCAGWGLTEAEMEALPEASANMAYTRYVLEKGAQGDLLDLYVALAPCVIGYGEIGARLAGAPATVREGNPYLSWIEMYGGEEYQDVARAHGTALDRLWRTRAGEARLRMLEKTFEQASRLEADFWQMGLDAA
ncbi:MAG: thiaminase II [Alphaproteobacteria bacterium]|nr:thiaminase II [Alphaproteobacteria bacterium]